MRISEITDFFQFCKWAQLQDAAGIQPSEKLYCLLVFPDIFARQLKDDGYNDEFIKILIKYVHKYKLDRIKNKLPEIKEYDYTDEKDKDIIKYFFNRFTFRRIDSDPAYNLLS